MKSKSISLTSRENRMDKIFGAQSPDEKCKLLKSLKISNLDRQKVFYSLQNFVYICLINNHKNKSYEFRDDFFDVYLNDILALPNVTPNGLILPKFENIGAYNQFFSAVNDAYVNSGITQFIDRVQFPINIRMQTGIPDQAVNARGRASTKAHTDIWAGDPINSILSFLPIVGDPKKVSGIDFYRTDGFPKDLIRLLDNYDDGKKLLDLATKLRVSFDNRGWFFSDSYLLHNTTKNHGKGLRISIDFRFIPLEPCDSDSKKPFLDKNKKEFFIKYEKFKEIGKTIFLYTDEKMHDGFVKKDYISGYPVKLKFK